MKNLLSKPKCDWLILLLVFASTFVAVRLVRPPRNLRNNFEFSRAKLSPCNQNSTSLTFEVKNLSTTDQKLLEVVPTCGCTVSNIQTDRDGHLIVNFQADGFDLKAEPIFFFVRLSDKNFELFEINSTMMVQNAEDRLQIQMSKSTK